MTRYILFVNMSYSIVFFVRIFLFIVIMFAVRMHHYKNSGRLYFFDNHSRFLAKNDKDRVTTSQ